MSEVKLTLAQRIKADELYEKMVENQTYEEAAYELIFLQDELSRLKELCSKAAIVIREMEQNFREGKLGFSADFIDELLKEAGR